MNCSNTSCPVAGQEQGAEWLVLPPCNRYICPLLPVNTLIPVTVVCLALLVLGVAGNVLTVMVMGRCRELHNTTSLYLGSLAVSDLLLLFGLPLDLYRLWRSRPWVLGSVMCSVWHWSSEACAYCSVLHLTALTAERYLAICFPLRAKVWVTRRRVKVLLLVLWAVALLSATPFLFLVGVRQAGNVSFSRECAPTAHARQSGLLSTMLWITTSYFVLPFLCLFVLYSFIIRELLHGKKRHLGGASHRSHQQTVRMLVVLVLAFVICWLPFHVGRIIYINSRDTKTMKFSQYFNIFALQLFYLSASINPVLYNLICKRYRAAAYKLLMTKRAGERASTVIRETASYTETSNSIKKGNVAYLQDFFSGGTRRNRVPEPLATASPTPGTGGGPGSTMRGQILKIIPEKANIFSFFLGLPNRGKKRRKKLLPPKKGQKGYLMAAGGFSALKAEKEGEGEGRGAAGPFWGGQGAARPFLTPFATTRKPPPPPKGIL